MQQEPQINYIRASVRTVDEQIDATGYTTQYAQIELQNGSQNGAVIDIENPLTSARKDIRMHEGQSIVLQHITRPDGSENYYFQETYRLSPLLASCALFILATALIGKKKGIMALIGLIVSVLIIFFILFPLILDGWNAYGVSIGSAFLIACSTILIAHGMNRRALITLTATCITLVCAIALASIAVHWIHLYGLGNDESIFLVLNPNLQIDPRGLLLASIIIGTLGVLDDITASQVATIDEVHKANPSYGWRKLYHAGYSVGSEHIASMINTLALAYIGTTLPMLLLLSTDADAPLWVILNSAFIGEEIIRTVIGSGALLLATPIATFLAAWTYGRAK